MMPSDIPRSGREALAKLLQSSTEFLDALYAELLATGPSLFGGAGLVARLHSKLSAHPEAEPPVLRNILRMLTGVLSIREDETSEELATELIRVAKTAGERDLSGAKRAAWTRLHTYLEKFFDLEQLRISAKAGTLFFSTPRHMHTARVLTDARPIFTKTAEEGPTAFLILHTLQVQYHEEDTEKEWYLALDSADLEILRDAMNRAIEKEKTLSKSLRKSKLPILTFREQQDADI